jgi:hypothetical protein
MPVTQGVGESARQQGSESAKEEVEASSPFDMASLRSLREHGKFASWRVGDWFRRVIGKFASWRVADWFRRVTFLKL